MSTLEERVEAAIVSRFFEPSWIVSPGMVTDPSTGHVRSEPMMTQIPSEMSVIAQAVYDRARIEIVRKVIEQMDIDVIISEWAPLIAKDVVSQLQKVNDGYGWQPKPSATERAKMMDKVYDMVAEEFGRQCVEHIKNTGGLMAVLEA